MKLIIFLTVIMLSINSSHAEESNNENISENNTTENTDSIEDYEYVMRTKI